MNGRVSDFQFNSIGSLATFIDGRAGIDAITARGFPANYFRPNAQFGQIFFQDSGGDSYYHGLFVAARRRFEQGLDFGFSYTFSKSIDDMSVDPTGAATGGGLSTTNFSRTPTDIHNFRLDRALSPLLGDARPTVRKRAIEALGNVGGKAIAPLTTVVTRTCSLPSLPSSAPIDDRRTRVPYVPPATALVL